MFEEHDIYRDIQISVCMSLSYWMSLDASIPTSAEFF